MSFWFVVKPATEQGNAEPNLMINSDYVVTFRKAKKDERGTCSFVLSDGTLIPTWADYKILKEKISE